ncbi:MAG: enoyl-CoA hydratase/isomerase family protein [Candidatus Rokubacteria bacterium]|nr:enoyl-CoA hydratase/isomerase family protein [Candidatus Rokubacteria bacterium]
MADPLLLVDRRDGAAWVRLNRPPLNLMIPELIRSIRDTFDELAHESGTRLAVLTGNGRAFTAGMDVRVMKDLTVLSAKALITLLHEAIHTVHEAPFPVIAMLNGYCLGAGLELAMACDLRTASTEARLGLPEIKVGIPSVIEAALLPGLVGPGRAAEILLTGEMISASEALQWGLLNRVVPGDQLEAVTSDLAARILAAAPSALRLQKELIVRWRQTDLRSGVEYGINAFATCFATGEPREAMTAFLEKREPRFGG